MKNHRPIANGQFKQGYYRIVNETKYIGNKSEIIFRSSWELDFCKFLDSNPLIVKWASEPLHIDYLELFDNTMHKYYPDFLFAMRKEDGTVQTYIAEVKPKRDVSKPSKPKRCTDKAMENYNRQSKVYLKNLSKYKAAKAYCEQRGWEYIIVTEDWFRQTFFSTKY